MPAANAFETAIIAFRSTNGGASWANFVAVASAPTHTVAGNLRTGPLPSAEIDGAGNVYVTWQDCRFRRGCKLNDLVMTTSTDGVSWSAVSRIPIDPLTSGVDHCIPGLGVDSSTSGATARLGPDLLLLPIVEVIVSVRLDHRDGRLPATEASFEGRPSRAAGPVHTVVKGMPCADF